MTPITIVHVTVAVPACILVAGDGVGGRAVADAAEQRARALAHVLQDDVALEIGIVAAVLCGPFNRKLGADVVLQRAHVDAAAAVVLGVEQTIRVVAIAVGLVQPRIGNIRAKMKR